MTSPEFQSLLASSARSTANPDASTEEAVAAYRRYCDDCRVIDGVVPTIAPTTLVKRVSVSGLTAEWIIARNADPDLRLLFIHGGAFIAGSLDGYRHEVEALSLASGMAVLAVDYRLAPEHPYPAGLDDCLVTWQWLLANGAKSAGAPRAAFLAGPSAGGNLSLALMLRLRDEGRPLPRAAAVFSPAADFTCSSPSMTERAELDPSIDPQSVSWVAGLYLPAGTPLEHPHVSPVFGNFSGLPPFLVHAGEREVMHDDGKRVVENARQAGVDAHFKTLPGMIHGIEYWCHFVPEGRASLNEVGAFLKSRA